MRHFLKLLAIVALVAAPQAAGAQDIRINPVPPGVKPQWTQVPGAPQVSWAPNLPTDVFRYRGKYYFFWENFFYQGPRPEGPWKPVVKVPEVFYQRRSGLFQDREKSRGGAAPAPGGADAVAQGQNHRHPADRPAGPGSPGAGSPPPRPAPNRRPR